jgi:hypothetical protein
MKRIQIYLGALVLVSLFACSTARAAPIQTSGSEEFGRVWIGVHPIGGQVFFDREDSIFKFSFDVLGRIANAGGLTFWLGGELNVGGVANYALIEPGIVFQISFEKLIKIPLVPHARFGFSGGVDNYYGSGTCYTPGVGLFPCNNYSFTAGDFWVKLGGGLHYFIIKQVGLGIDTNFGLGVQIYDQNGARQTPFRGYFDFLVGAVFTF